MVVVSDTSCLSALIRIGRLDILKSLFGKIIIPPKVSEELSLLSQFGVDISAFSSCDWIEETSPTDLSLLKQLMLTLDEGEAQAITLAVECSVDWLIIDELAGRNVAASLSINFIGLAGILLLAKEEGVIAEVKPILDTILSETSFRLSESLVTHILNTAGE